MHLPDDAGIAAGRNVLATTMVLAVIRQSDTTLYFDTRGRGFLEITRTVSDWVAASSIERGLLTAFVRHTSASLLIQENADPDVRARSGALLRAARTRWRRAVSPSRRRSR